MAESARRRRSGARDAPALTKPPSLGEQLRTVGANLGPGLVQMAKDAGTELKTVAMSPLGLVDVVAGTNLAPHTRRDGETDEALAMRTNPFSTGFRESASRTGGRLTQGLAAYAPGGMKPSEAAWAKASSEGRIVEALAEDLGNFSLAAGGVGRAAGVLNAPKTARWAATEAAAKEAADLAEASAAHAAEAAAKAARGTVNPGDAAMVGMEAEVLATEAAVARAAADAAKKAATEGVLGTIEQGARSASTLTPYEYELRTGRAKLTPTRDNLRARTPVDDSYVLRPARTETMALPFVAAGKTLKAGALKAGGASAAEALGGAFPKLAARGALGDAAKLASEHPTRLVDTPRVQALLETPAGEKLTQWQDERAQKVHLRDEHLQPGIGEQAIQGKRRALLTAEAERLLPDLDDQYAAQIIQAGQQDIAAKVLQLYPGQREAVVWEVWGTQDPPSLKTLEQVKAYADGTMDPETREAFDRSIRPMRQMADEHEAMALEGVGSGTDRPLSPEQVEPEPMPSKIAERLRPLEERIEQSETRLAGNGRREPGLVAQVAQAEARVPVVNPRAAVPQGAVKAIEAVGGAAREQAVMERQAARYRKRRADLKAKFDALRKEPPPPSGPVPPPSPGAGPGPAGPTVTPPAPAPQPQGPRSTPEERSYVKDVRKAVKEAGSDVEYEVRSIIEANHTGGESFAFPDLKVRFARRGAERAEGAVVRRGQVGGEADWYAALPQDLRTYIKQTWGSREGGMAIEELRDPEGFVKLAETLRDVQQTRSGQKPPSPAVRQVFADFGREFSDAEWAAIGGRNLDEAAERVRAAADESQPVDLEAEDAFRQEQAAARAADVEPWTQGQDAFDAELDRLIEHLELEERHRANGDDLADPQAVQEQINALLARPVVEPTPAAATPPAVEAPPSSPPADLPRLTDPKGVIRSLEAEGPSYELGVLQDVARKLKTAKGKGVAAQLKRAELPDPEAVAARIEELSPIVERLKAERGPGEPPKPWTGPTDLFGNPDYSARQGVAVERQPVAAGKQEAFPIEGSIDAPRIAMKGGVQEGLPIEAVRREAREAGALSDFDKEMLTLGARDIHGVLHFLAEEGFPGAELIDAAGRPTAVWDEFGTAMKSRLDAYLADVNRLVDERLAEIQSYPDYDPSDPTTRADVLNQMDPGMEQMFRFREAMDKLPEPPRSSPADPLLSTHTEAREAIVNGAPRSEAEAPVVEQVIAKADAENLSDVEFAETLADADRAILEPEPDAGDGTIPPPPPVAGGEGPPSGDLPDGVSGPPSGPNRERTLGQLQGEGRAYGREATNSDAQAARAAERRRRLAEKAAERIEAAMGKPLRAGEKRGKRLRDVEILTRAQLAEQRKLSWLEDKLDAETARLEQGPLEVAPGRYKPALLGGARARQALNEMADEMYEATGDPFAGEYLREFADDIATTMQELHDAGVFPEYLMGGVQEAPQGAVRGITKMLRLPKKTKLVSERAKTTGSVLPTYRAQGRVYVEDVARRIQNVVAEKVANDPRIVTPASKLIERAIADLPANDPASKLLREKYETALAHGGHDLGKFLEEEFDVTPWDPKGDNYNVTYNAVTGETLFIPNKLRKEFDRSFSQAADPKVVQWMIDNPTRVWKHMVLALNPNWQVGNMIGNTLMASFGAGLTPDKLFRYGRESFRLLAEEGSLPKSLQGRFGGEVTGDLHFSPRLYDAGQAGEMIRYFRENPRKVTQGEGVRGRLPKWMQNLHPIQASYELNNFVDNWGRSTVYLARKADGLSDAAAVEAAVKSMGDFNNMTTFERKFVRRAMPFWAWAKHITLLSGRLAFHHPMRVAWMLHLGGLVTEDEDYELPEFLKGSVKVGDKRVTIGYLNPFGDYGVSPLTDPKELLRSLGPTTKLAGAAIGVNVAKGRLMSRAPGYGPVDDFGAPSPGFLSPKELAYVLSQQTGITRTAVGVSTEQVRRYDTGQPIKLGGKKVPVDAGRGEQVLRGLGIPFVPQSIDVEGIQETRAERAARRQTDRERYENGPKPRTGGLVR